MNCLEKNQILEQHNLVRQLVANGKVTFKIMYIAASYNAALQVSVFEPN